MNERHSILVVDDEPSMIEILGYNLGKEGYRVKSAQDGNEALRLFREDDFSLVILDIMMPGLDGFDVCREIRKHSGVPIIMLTAKTAETSKIVGLELGADDYITKPFSIAELVARVKAVLRRCAADKYRQNSETAGIISCREMKIDIAKRQVSIRGKTLDLTSKEFDILQMLASNPGIVFTREQILDRVWGDESYVVDRAIDVHVRHLRQKTESCEDGRRYITTVRGVGYKFNDSDEID